MFILSFIIIMIDILYFIDSCLINKHMLVFIYFCFYLSTISYYILM